MSNTRVACTPLAAAAVARRPHETRLRACAMCIRYPTSFINDEFLFVFLFHPLFYIPHIIFTSAHYATLHLQSKLLWSLFTPECQVLSQFNALKQLSNGYSHGRKSPQRTFFYKIEIVKSDDEYSFVLIYSLVVNFHCRPSLVSEKFVEHRQSDCYSRTRVEKKTEIRFNFVK